MPPYKRQHYLPTSYLKYFSVDRAKHDGDPRVWRHDLNSSRLVPVRSQCWADYHYSKAQPAAAERSFHTSERRYSHCVDAIISGRDLTTHEYGDLLMAMFDLHVRNAAHRNQTGKEGIEAYYTRSRIFLNDLLLHRTGGASTDEIVAHVGQNWNLRILLSAPGSIFITSDHPSAWISLKTRLPGVHIVLLPLTPSHIAFAYDKRFVQFIDKLITHDDQFTLNAAQIENSIECVYASQPIPDQELALIKEHLDEKPDKSPSVVSENSWQLKLVKLRPEHHFSFIRTTPPIL